MLDIFITWGTTQERAKVTDASTVKLFTPVSSDFRATLCVAIFVHLKNRYLWLLITFLQDHCFMWKCWLDQTPCNPLKYDIDVNNVSFRQWSIISWPMAMDGGNQFIIPHVNIPWFSLCRELNITHSGGHYRESIRRLSPHSLVMVPVLLVEIIRKKHRI